MVGPTTKTDATDANIVITLVTQPKIIKRRQNEPHKQPNQKMLRNRNPVQTLEARMRPPRGNSEKLPKSVIISP
jgi:hypothetical protein